MGRIFLNRLDVGSSKRTVKGAGSSECVLIVAYIIAATMSGLAGVTMMVKPPLSLEGEGWGEGEKQLVISLIPRMSASISATINNTTRLNWLSSCEMALP